MIFDWLRGIGKGIKKTCKNRFDWSRGIEKESRQPESLSLKNWVFLFHFDRSKNKFNRSNLKKSKILKNWKFSEKPFGKQIFMIWDAC